MNVKFKHNITSWASFNFQNTNSYIILEFIFFHDQLNFILLFILRVVFIIIIFLTFNKRINLYLSENQLLESIWILAPALILTKIGAASLYLLYLTDDAVDSSISLKTRAHQWYWRYEYTDFWGEEFDSSLEFDSYMVPLGELESGMVRLLETDNRPVLPFMVQSRILITRLDVLHSWTVPRLGVKADANPGRINQVKFFPYQPGVYYGQCSEICGANHRFIPISLEFFDSESFLAWIYLNRHEF